MASNFSSYGSSYSSSYNQHHSPYSHRGPPYNGGQESIRSRSLSYNDLSSQYGHQPSQNLFPRTPMPQYIPTFHARGQVADTRPKVVTSINHAQPKTSPASNDTSAAATVTTPAALSRYRGRHIRGISAGSVEDKHNAYQQHHQKKIYNASISSSEISIDSESLRTQTSISSVGSTGSWQEEETKPVHKISRSQSTPSVLSQKEHSHLECVDALPLRLNTLPVSMVPAEVACEPSSPATVKAGTVEDVDFTPTKHSIRTVRREQGDTGSISQDKEHDASISEFAKNELSKLSHELTLPSDFRPVSLYSNSTPSQTDASASSVAKPASPPATGHHMSLCDDSSTSKKAVEAKATDSSDSELPSPLPPPPALLAEKPKTALRAPLASSVPSPVGVSSHRLPSIAKLSLESSQTVPKVKKSRSIGARLKDMLGGGKHSSSDRTIDDDSKSIMSTKSNFSIRSSSSMMSIASKFRRKKKEVDDCGSTNSSDNSSNSSFRSPLNRNSLSGDASVRSFSSASRAGANLSTSSVNSAASTSRSAKKAQNFAPRPPSPALRSSIGYFEESSRSASPSIKSVTSAIVSGAGKPTKAESANASTDSLVVATPAKSDNELAPPNLAAGDIYPGNLKSDNVEVIMSSVERTGSFKRQPSTKKRTKEEIVPHPQEIESEIKRKPSFKRPKASIMKNPNRQNSRRRSGASASSVSFASQILVYKTYSGSAYDRTPDRMTCDMLSTPGVAQRLREELNQWKTLMEIHPESQRNTQYFQI